MRAENSPKSSPPARQPLPLGGMRVLVVEDTEINREVARIVLEQAGARVETVVDGEAAVALLAGRPEGFDIVLMDIEMPGPDGYETTRIIRSRLGLAGLPIVAMTASAGESDRAKADEAGMNGHLGKPVDVQGLIATLKAQVAGRTAVLGRRAPAGDGGAASPLQPEQFPGVDLTTALLRLGGDRSMWISLVRQFEASQGGAVAEVRGCLAKGRGAEAAGIAHRLRGVAANLGATEVSRLAEQLEVCLKSGAGGVDTDGLLDRLDGAVGELAALARRLPEPPRKSIPGLVSGELPSALEQLRSSLRDSNLKALAQYAAMEANLKKAMPEETVQALATAIDTLDFASAEGLVLNMMQIIARGGVHGPERDS